MAGAGLDLEFTPRQKLILRYAIVALAATTIILIIVFGVLVLGRVLSFLNALVFPLATAGILALILFPIVKFFERRLRVSRLAAVIVLFVLMTLILVSFFVFVVPMAVEQGIQFINTIPEIMAQGREMASRKFPNAFPVVEKAIEDVDMEDVAPEFEAKTAMRYVSLAVGLGFVPLYLFFALLSGPRVRYHAKNMLSVFNSTTQNEMLYMGQSFVGYLTAFFRGQLMIALIMGVMMAIGFTLVGLKGGLLFGMLLGLLNIVPYLGFVVGMLTVMPVAFIQDGGGMQLAGMVLGVIAFTQVVESMFLTPKIMADRSGLHPMLVVISVIFWGTVLSGVVGMILAVPLTAFLLSWWHHIRQRYFGISP